MASNRVGGPSRAKLPFGIALTLVIVVALVDSASLAWALSPLILVLVVYSAFVAPLRHSLTVLALCAFTLDYPNEAMAAGLYKTPFYSVGFAMLTHLNNLTGIRAMSFSGTDILLVVLTLVALLRESSRSKIDRLDRIETPKLLLQLAKTSVLAALGVWLMGLVTGGNFAMSLWQLEKVVYVPWLCWLWSIALRGPQDLGALAKALVAAAMVRAAWAIYVVQTVIPPVDPMTGLAQLPYATGHSDSVLFASAFVLLVLVQLERLGSAKLRRQLWLLFPFLIWGMVANNRRLVWVHVGATLLTLYVVSPDNPFKKRARRLLYVIAPLFSVYLVAGWDNQNSSIFKPARIVRSVVEPATDGSSLWRELENFNLIYTIKLAPIFGQGYGHAWVEVIQLPMVSYNLEYYLPHNSLLGLLYCAGVVGYTLITLLWAGGVYFGMRAYHAAVTPTQRVSAILCVGSVFIYQIQAFGDIGLGCWMGVHIMAPSIVIAGKLAVAHGAWWTPRSDPQAVAGS